MFDNLSQRLDKAWDLVRKDGKLTAVNIKEPMREIRRALLEADVRPFKPPTEQSRGTFTSCALPAATADFQDAPRPSCVPVIHQYMLTNLSGSLAPALSKGSHLRCPSIEVITQ